jgi:AcrR family transcriptional regulator
MTALAGAAAAGLQIAPICGQPPRPAHLPSRRRGGPRSRLTREKVLRAALDFVDANGLAALSMHKLGAELGVQGMSLYSHVESKDALLDGIVEAMSADLRSLTSDLPGTAAAVVTGDGPLPADLPVIGQEPGAGMRPDWCLLCLLVAFPPAGIAYWIVTARRRARAAVPGRSPLPGATAR